MELVAWERDRSQVRGWPLTLGQDVLGAETGAWCVGHAWRPAGEQRLGAGSLCLTPAAALWLWWWPYRPEGLRHAGVAEWEPVEGLSLSLCPLGTLGLPDAQEGKAASQGCAARPGGRI